MMRKPLNLVNLVSFRENPAQKDGYVYILCIFPRICILFA